VGEEAVGEEAAEEEAAEEEVEGEVVAGAAEAQGSRGHRGQTIVAGEKDVRDDETR